jgi:hypothetical protein
MMPRGVAVAFLAGAIAGSACAQDSRQVFQAAIDDLSAPNAKGLWLLFDPTTPGYKEIRKDTEALLNRFDVTAKVTFLGGDRMKWILEMTDRGGARSRTTRTAEVTAKVSGERIVAFEPSRLFAPPDADSAWESLATASAALAHEDDNAGGVPFLAVFDRAMPGFDNLQANVAALSRDLDVDAALELTANDGTDTERTLMVDWELSLTSRGTEAATKHRRENVVAKMKKEGSKWKVVSLQPLSLFGPPQ